MELTNLALYLVRVLICTFVAFASLPIAAADNFPMFRIKKLGTLGEVASLGADLNNAGQATGYVSSPGKSQAFLYNNGAMTGLGTLGGHHSSGRAINAVGQVTGTASLDECNLDCDYELPHAFLFSNGEMIDLGDFPGAEESFGSAINRHGQVALTDLTPEGDGFAWRVSDGDVETRVFVADGLFGRVTGLNNEGYVTGYREVYFDVPCGNCFRAFVGKNFDELIELGSLGDGLFSVSAAINNAGQIAGTSGTVITDPERPWEVRPHAFLYADGTMKDLGTLGGLTSTGLAINGAGKVTGFADTGTGTEHAFLWDGTTMQDLGTLGGTTSRGHAINGKGWVTGTSDIAGDVDTHAFLSDGGQMVALKSLVDPADPLKAHVTLHSGVDVNNAGQVLVNGLDKRTNTQHAFIVSPMEYQVSFVAPVAGARPKAGSTVTIKAALVDNVGKRISDARARSLVAAPCQVKFSASGAQTKAASCMKYDTANNLFFFNWKLGTAGTGAATMKVNATYQFSVPATVTATQSRPITIIR